MNYSNVDTFNILKTPPFVVTATHFCSNLHHPPPQLAIVLAGDWISWSWQGPSVDDRIRRFRIRHCRVRWLVLSVPDNAEGRTSKQKKDPHSMAARTAILAHGPASPSPWWVVAGDGHLRSMWWVIMWYCSSEGKWYKRLLVYALPWHEEEARSNSCHM